MPGFTTIFFGLGPGLVPYGTGLRAGAQVLFGTTSGTVAYGEKLPGPYPINTIGATPGDGFSFNGTEFVVSPGGGGGVTNPLTSDLSAAGLYSVTSLRSPAANSSDAVRQIDVEALAYKGRVRLATAAALPAFNYASGVITAAGNGALTVDGSAVAVADLVLVWQESGGNRAYHGIYTVTATGSGGAPYVLARAANFSTSADISAGCVVYVTSGTVLAGNTIALRTAGTIVLDTTVLEFGPLVTSGKYVERIAAYAGLELGSGAGSPIQLYPGGSSARLTAYSSGCVALGSAPDVGAADVLAFPLAGQGTFRDGSNTRQFFYFASGELHLGYYTSVTPNTHVEAGTAVHLSVASAERVRVDGNDNLALGASIVATSGRSAGLSLPYASRVEARNNADGGWINLIRLGTAISVADTLILGSDAAPERILAGAVSRVNVGISAGTAPFLQVSDDSVKIGGGVRYRTRLVSGTVTVGADDATLWCDTSSAAVTVNLPVITAAMEGMELVIKDVKHLAGTNNITTNCGSGDGVDGDNSVTSIVINSNKGRIVLRAQFVSPAASFWHQLQ